MIRNTIKSAPPSNDPRWKLVDAAMRRHGYSPSALVETLHTIQEAFGFISCDSLQYIAGQLNAPPSKVYGVATFYNHFIMTPPAKHTLRLCTGTTCYMKGAAEILEFLRESYGLQPGDSTGDGSHSIGTTHCAGACSQAPVIMLDDVFMRNSSIDEIKTGICEWLKDDK